MEDPKTCGHCSAREVGGTRQTLSRRPLFAVANESERQGRSNTPPPDMARPVSSCAFPNLGAKVSPREQLRNDDYDRLFARGASAGDQSGGAIYLNGAFRSVRDAQVSQIEAIQNATDVVISAAGRPSGFDASAYPHDCLAKLKATYLQRRGLLMPGDRRAWLLSALLQRDVPQRNGRIRSRSQLEQLINLKRFQRAWFGLNARIFLKTSGPEPDVDGSIDDFFRSPSGLPDDDACPCCEMSNLLLHGNAIIFGLEHPDARDPDPDVRRRAADQNQPMLVTSVDCPPCFDCEISGESYDGVPMPGMKLKTTPPNRGELHLDGNLKFRVTAVVVEPRVT